MKSLVGFFVVLLLVIIVIVYYIMLRKTSDPPQQYTVSELIAIYNAEPTALEKTSGKLIIEGIIDSLYEGKNNQVAYMFCDYESKILRGVKIEMEEKQDIDVLMTVVLGGYFSKRCREWLVFKGGIVIKKNNE